MLKSHFTSNFRNYFYCSLMNFLVTWCTIMDIVQLINHFQTSHKNNLILTSHKINLILTSTENKSDPDVKENKSDPDVNRK